MAKRSVQHKAVVKSPVIPRHADVTMTTLARPLQLVRFVEGGQGVHVPSQYLPAQFRSGTMHTGTFAAVADWREPSDAVAGTFRRVRPDVGPNQSRIYELLVDDPDLLNGRKPFEANFWGSTQLDALFDTHLPVVEGGDKICVIFLGTKATKRALSPVKLFALSVVKTKK